MDSFFLNQFSKKTTYENREAHGPFEEEESVHSKFNNEDVYEDPFGTYETMEKIKLDKERKKEGN